MRAWLILRSSKVQFTVFLFWSFISSSIAFGRDAASVHFCSFHIATFVPITTFTVATDCAEKWSITDESKVARLAQLLSHGKKHKFDEETVRVAADVGGQTYFIDSYGVVKNGSRSYKIDKKRFLEFRDSLNANEVEKPN